MVLFLVKFALLILNLSNMKKTISLFILIGSFLMISSFSGQSQIVVKVKPNRPQAVVVQPVAPKNGHLWIDGHWLWSKKENKYVWVKGHWEKPPRPGAVWTPGYWMDAPGGYKWVPGHWKSPKEVHSKKQLKGPRK